MSVVESVSVSVSVNIGLLKAVSLACGANGRWGLGNVCLESGGQNGAKIVGTDGRWLMAACADPFGTTDGRQVLIPASLINRLPSTKRALAQNCLIKADSERVELWCPGGVVHSASAEPGLFPLWRSIFRSFDGMDYYDHFQLVDPAIHCQLIKAAKLIGADATDILYSSKRHQIGFTVYSNNPLYGVIMTKNHGVSMSAFPDWLM